MPINFMYFKKDKIINRSNEYSKFWKIEKIKYHSLYIYKQESERIVNEKCINIRKLSMKIYILYIVNL